MQYLTIKQAAARLQVSTNTVRRMLPEIGAIDIHAGAGKYRCIRIPEEAMDKLLSRHTIAAPEPLRPAKPFHLERRREE